MLQSQNSSARPCERIFPPLVEDLGEVESMVIGPLRQCCMGNKPGSADNSVRLPGSQVEEKVMPIPGGAPLQYEWAMAAHDVKEIFELEDFGELKADLHRIFCAGDLLTRYWIYRNWLKVLNQIPPQLLTDRTCLEKARDALYVECAYRYIFGVLDHLPVLATDGEYLASANDDGIEVQSVLRATWSLSLRTVVLLSPVDYDALVTDQYGRWLSEAKRRPNPNGLAWPKGLVWKTGSQCSAFLLYLTTKSLVLTYTMAC